MVIKKDQPLGPLFPCNLVLWRQANFKKILTHGISVRISDCPFIKNDRGSWVAKISLNGATGLWEPEIIPSRFEGRPTFGIMLFLKEQPTPDWTHIMVTGVSKKLATESKGGAVFGRAPSRPYAMQDYIDFRSKMFQVVSKNLNCSFLDKTLMSSLNNPAEERTNQLRLVSYPLIENELEYDHV